MLRLIVNLDPMDPALGLALEEAIITTTRQGTEDVLRIWVNRSCVIIGRSQSVASEVDLTRLRHLRIPVIRRISGGGAVYHYEGNLNLSLFLRDKNLLGTIQRTYKVLGQTIVDALSRIGVDAQVEGNTILVGGEKIAGAAQVRRGKGLLYHTTLLVSPSLVPIDNLLLAMRGSYAPAFVPSHPRSLTSLSQISPGITMERLVPLLNDAVANLLGQGLRNDGYTQEELALAGRLRIEKYGSDKWNLYR